MLLPCLVFGGLSGLFAFRGKADAPSGGVQILYSQGYGVTLVHFAVLLALLGVFDNPGGQQTGTAGCQRNEQAIGGAAFNRTVDRCTCEELQKKIKPRDEFRHAQAQGDTAVF